MPFSKVCCVQEMLKSRTKPLCSFLLPHSCSDPPVATLVSPELFANGIRVKWQKYRKRRKEQTLKLENKVSTYYLFLSTELFNKSRVAVLHVGHCISLRLLQLKLSEEDKTHRAPVAGRCHSFPQQLCDEGLCPHSTTEETASEAFRVFQGCGVWT